jgi:predicted pyridoxine 5'-phosphate oxidase superfamily flavin-nucleotide-binding protein
MATTLSKEIRELFADAQSVKVLATLDESGFPHAVAAGSLQVGEDGNLHYLELLESSRTNKNLVRSIWYDQRVAIAIQGAGGQSYQIKGLPVKTHITGALFQQHYAQVRQRLGDVDLAAVWIIEPLEVINENLVLRRAEAEQAHPVFSHLDRLARH